MYTIFALSSWTCVATSQHPAEGQNVLAVSPGDMILTGIRVGVSMLLAAAIWVLIGRVILKLEKDAPAHKVGFFGLVVVFVLVSYRLF